MKIKQPLLFSGERGALAGYFRMALGALIIKEKLGISDRGLCVKKVWGGPEVWEPTPNPSQEGKWGELRK